MTPPDFPFRFYGSRPGDWYEGASQGHFYEVQFMTVPDPAARRALAQRFEAELASGAVEPGTAWLWSGPWALFRVGERYIGRFDSFFRKMARLLRGLHQVAPIAQVTFWGLRAEGRDPWDLWTRAQQPVPTPGPHYPGLERPRSLGQASDPALPAPGRDPDFEAARRG